MRRGKGEVKETDPPGPRCGVARVRGSPPGRLRLTFDLPTATMPPHLRFMSPGATAED
jgi:hypothetical protein